VSSRAFLVDAYHGLSMVPIADAFVSYICGFVQFLTIISTASIMSRTIMFTCRCATSHFFMVKAELNGRQTEFNVCAHCGSLYECTHDQEIDPEYSQPVKTLPPTIRKEASALFYAENDLDQFYEMVSNTPIQSHAEVFNTYGETLTNAQLLTQYGFILDANENDCITWDLSEVYQWLVGRNNGNGCQLGQLLSVWTDIFPKAVQDRMFASVDSQLIYFHSQDTSSELCLNGDGKISHQLWVLLALPFCVRGKRDGDTVSILKTLENFLAYQAALEGGRETNSDEAEAIPGDNPDVTIITILAGLAQSVVDLCVTRKNGVGKEESNNMTTHGDISDRLDVSPQRELIEGYCL
jgi:hypothetical protein